MKAKETLSAETAERKSELELLCEFVRLGEDVRIQLTKRLIILYTIQK